MKKQTSAGAIRIIAGEWRSRKLPVADVPGLRPTTDRLRETLFNWLQHSVIESRCLDLFAGSGALGFEAASRGAKEVVMIEQNRTAAKGLEQSIALLKTDKLIVHQIDALNWIDKPEQAFDIIFVDPPFDLNLGSEVLEKLANSKCVKSGTVIYLEEEKQHEQSSIPNGLECIKQGSSKQVSYSLLKVS